MHVVRKSQPLFLLLFSSRILPLRVTNIYIYPLELLPPQSDFQGKKLCVVSKLFHYKDRSSKFFVICALKFSSTFPFRQNRKRETRENGLSHLSRLVFFVARCFLPGELLEEGSTSSTTGVSDDLASVEREDLCLQNRQALRSYEHQNW